MIRVLVVDDSPDVRLALKMMLEITGFAVSEAEAGEEALERLASQQIDVVLADLVMSGMDGLSLINNIALRSPPRPSVIAMTGRSNLGYSASLEAARALGADAVLIKPFSHAELRALIHRLVGGGPALVEDRRHPGSSAGMPERRRQRRTPEETTATSIIQTVLSDISHAADGLKKDLRLGADPKVIGALLATAETLAWGRGVDIRLRIQEIRNRLEEGGYSLGSSR